MSFLRDPIGWLEHAWYHWRGRVDPLHMLRSALGPPLGAASLLDFGAGTGWVSAALRTHVPAEYTLADVGAAGHESSAEPCFRRVLLPDRGPVPLPDGQFDGAFLVDVVHHLPAAGEAFRELRRLLRPGGRLVVIEYDRALPAGRLLAIACRVFRRRRLRTADQLLALCAQAGFCARSVAMDGLRTCIIADRPAA